MSRALDGTNPLSYQGVRPRTPPDMVVPGYVGTSQPRNPTQNDINYNVGDFWLNTAGPTLWYLSFLGSHVVSGYNARYAIWLPFVQGTGFLKTLSGDAGVNPVTADVNANINVFGDNTVGLTVIGDGVHTLLVTTSGGQPVGQGLTGNSGGFVPFNLAGNINVVGAAGLALTFVGNPGTNTLTLTGSSGGSVGQSVTTDDAHVVLPDAGGNWNFTGAHGINTSGVVATHTYTAAINNTITLGDLAIVTAGNAALTLQSGDLTISGTGANAAGNINIPNTTVDERQGEIRVAGSRFYSNFGTRNLFIGITSGSIANTGAQTGGNVALGTSALGAISAGGNGAIANTALGDRALSNYTFSTGVALTGGNTAVGADALFECTVGSANTCVGFGAGTDITTGDFNICIGDGAGSLLTTGASNLLIGPAAGVNTGGGPSGLLTGNNNIIIVTASQPTAYTNAESNNITINNTGVVGESNIMRLGTSGAGGGQVNKCFIAGIRGITTDAADAIAVLISSTGQLGTVSSSIRYKENVNDMADYSSGIMELRPVTFNYKDRSSERVSVGLIAEEVGEVMPDLVVFDEDGLPNTVRYHDIPILILNEMQKMQKEIQELRRLIKKK